ncbi:MAG: DUF6090 family protein, partial [Flavobacteriaceae bacterium]|nr:DUF6090 family protein [Flavobacteriaceae bacterium]
MKFLDQNKAGKYLLYAIGEILLVVLGILIALQINSWDQRNKNREREAFILKELHSEFLKNKEQFNRCMQVHQNAYEGCQEIVDQFPIDIDIVNLDSLSANLQKIFRAFTFNPSNGTINSLINTSSFELISNQELRQLLISWEDVVEDYREEEIYAQEFLRGVFNPYTFDYFDYDFDWSNPKNKMEQLETLKFQNYIRERLTDLEQIIENPEKEAQIVESSINRILEL